MKAFLTELKDRKVFRVAIVYLVAGWLVMQIADVMFPALGLPEWSVTLVAAFLIVGFPVALVLSWAYEAGPGGIRRDRRDTDNAPASADDKSVGVLPFADMSPGKDQEYFSDGLTEELLNVLAQLPGLRVCSRTSSFSLKNANADIHTVAERLGTAYVVEGSVRKADDNLRITAQLIEAASDTHLWSQTYDRELDDVFAIQDDIARQIARVLQVKLLPDSLPSPTTDDVEAYEYFLRGRNFFNRLGHQNIRNAIGMFEKATIADPEFARAWAGLALGHAYCVLLYGAGAADMHAADEASSRAIALSPKLADGYVARIVVCSAGSRGKEAEAAFRKAVELDPDNFEAYYHFGRYMYKQGKLERVIELWERAREIDPDDFQTPNVSVGVYEHLGDTDGALQAAQDGARTAALYVEQHPENARAWMLGANAFYHLGDRDKAMQFAEAALQADPDSEDTLYNGACLYARAGEIEKSLDCLERGGVHDTDWMDNDPDLDPLRGEPRFQALMARLRSNAS
ncbi:MAG: tetratricopeptide repeat protein [Woeseiaceae bacterium]|nr:tetratricopeptide repeat protein [Woeseiaceae bacterium]